MFNRGSIFLYFFHVDQDMMLCICSMEIKSDLQLGIKLFINSRQIEDSKTTIFLTVFLIFCCIDNSYILSR